MAISIGAIRQFFAKYFKSEQHEEEHINKIEAYISILYKLLIWEDAVLSSFALIIAHILFWIIVHFELRLYGIFFLTLLIIFVFDASFENIIVHTDKSIPLKSIRDTIQVMNAVFQYMTTLRKEYPGTFCIGMCIGFLVLSIIGRTLSGLLLTYIGFLSLVLTPGIIKNLPLKVLDGLKHALRIISTDEGVLNETELLPTGHSDGMIEDRDDCESTKTDKTAESCANSFISGVTSMPSYLEAEGSLDGLEEEDLEFTSRNIRGITPSNLSSDSSDSEHKDIKFESTHFNRDSSSDEDIHYSHGLTFSELDMVDKPKTVSLTQQISSDLLSNLGAMGSTLVSSVFNAATNTVPITKKSDSDSDFEIINSEDIQSSET